MTNQKISQSLKDVESCVSSETGDSKEQPKFPYPNPGQHSRINLNDAITQYKAKVLTSAGLVYHVVKIYRASGCRLRVQDVSAFCELLTINRSTFYKAINKLQESDLDFHWEPVDGIYLWIGESQSPNGESQSPNGESQSPNGESQSPNGESQSPNGESKSSRPLLDKLSSVYSNILQISNNHYNSLSDLEQDERENFEKFVKEEWKKTKNSEIESLSAVVRGEFFQEWYQKYQSRPEALKAAEITKWENHPHRNEWLAEIERTSNPMMFALSDEEKQAFIKWCWNTKQYSWLKEEGNSNGV